MSVPAYLAWATIGFIGLGSIDRLSAGRGLDGIFEVVFVFLWLGWIYVVGALPVWLAFRWSFAKLGPRLRGPFPLRGAVVGTVVWSASGLALSGILLLTHALSPDSQPTVPSVATGLTAVAVIGGVFGALEGRALGSDAARDARNA
jgi:hypothetical protein